MYQPEILFLKQEDVIQAGLLDMKKIMEITEDTFRMMGEGQVINPTKVFLGMPDVENWQSYCMSMPSYLGGDYNVVGFKWAAESVFNATQGMPYGVDLVVLSDPKTIYPKAVMDGTVTTAMRTSAAAGVCAKYTARKDSRTAALIGAGVIGRTMIMSMLEAVPGLEEIRIVDLNLKKAEALAAEFSERCLVVAGDDVKKAVSDVDVVVTETTSRKDFLPKSWLKKNATVIQMEMCSFAEENLLAADRVILDNWSQMSHLKGGLVNRLFEEGRLARDQVEELQDVVTGKAKGRVSDEEFIYCGTMGVGAVDIAIADKMYESAKAKGIGQKLMLWDAPLWI